MVRSSRQPFRFFRCPLPLLLFGAIYFLSCDILRTQHLRRIPIQVGEYHLTVEVARTVEERERGLMYRGKLGPDEGMLFVFPDTAVRSFWMKNTFIPLDVGYFDADGYLIEYHSMEPDNDRKTYTSSEPALYALEMRRGWFKEKGLKKYAKMTLPEVITGI